MNPQNRSKLNHQQEQQTHSENRTGSEHVTSHQHQTGEVATAEQMIHHDAVHTEVPARVAERLRDSIANEPRPDRPWWKRWLGQPG